MKLKDKIAIALGVALLGLSALGLLGKEWVRAASAAAQASACSSSGPASAAFPAAIEKLERLRGLPWVGARAGIASNDVHLRCLAAFRTFCNEARYLAERQATQQLRAERDRRASIAANAEERGAVDTWYDAQQDALEWRAHLASDLPARCAEWTSTVEVLRRAGEKATCRACDGAPAAP